jgi:hypothetical protein
VVTNEAGPLDIDGLYQKIYPSRFRDFAPRAEKRLEILSLAKTTDVFLDEIYEALFPSERELLLERQSRRAAIVSVLEADAIYDRQPNQGTAEERLYERLKNRLSSGRITDIEIFEFL